MKEMLLFTCIIFSFTLLAQDDTFNDIIELKNGSKLIGDLIFEDSANVIFHFPTFKDTLTIPQNTISFKRINDGTRQYYRGGKYHYVGRDYVFLMLSLFWIHRINLILDWDEDLLIVYQSEPDWVRTHYMQMGVRTGIYLYYRIFLSENISAKNTSPINYTVQQRQDIPCP